MSSRRGFQGLAFGAVLALLMLVFSEGMARVAIAVLQRNSRFDFTPIQERHRGMQARLKQLLDTQGDALVELDETIGWRYRANYRGELYSSNSQGARGRREYPSTKPDGIVRIVAFGDSFIHANEILDADAWSAQLEALDERVEVLNFGVGGYGTDQALLLHQRLEGQLEADVVVLGFAEVNYARNVNRFRRFLSVDELPLSKPRFKLSEAGELILIPNPFPHRRDLEALLEDPTGVLAAAPDDWFFEPLEWNNPLYDHLAIVRLPASLLSRAWRSRLRPDGLYRGRIMNTRYEGFGLLVALIEEFAAKVRRSGREFVFMIFPTRDSDVWGSGARTYQPLLERLEGLAVIDLADALSRAPEIHPDNLREIVHYSAESNRVAAGAVQRLAVDKGWLQRR